MNGIPAQLPTLLPPSDTIWTCSQHTLETSSADRIFWAGRARHFLSSPTRWSADCPRPRSKMSLAVFSRVPSSNGL